MTHEYAHSPVELSRELDILLLGHFVPEARFLERHEHLGGYALDPIRASHLYQGLRKALGPRQTQPVVWLTFLPDSWEQAPCGVGIAEAAAQSAGGSILAEVGDVHLPRPEGAPEPVDDMTQRTLETLLERPANCWGSDLGGVTRCIPTSKHPSLGPGVEAPRIGRPVFILSEVPGEVGGWIPNAKQVDGAVLVASFRDHSIPLLRWANDRIRSAGHRVLGLVAVGPRQVEVEDDRSPSPQPFRETAVPEARVEPVVPRKIHIPLSDREPLSPPDASRTAPPRVPEEVARREERGASVSEAPTGAPEPRARSGPRPEPTEERPDPSPRRPERPVEPASQGEDARRAPGKPPEERRVEPAGPPPVPPPLSPPPPPPPPRRPAQERRPPAPPRPVRKPAPVPPPKEPEEATPVTEAAVDEESPSAAALKTNWALRHSSQTSLRRSVAQRLRSLFPWLAVLVVAGGFAYWKLGPSLSGSQSSVSQATEEPPPADVGQSDRPDGRAAAAAASLLVAGGPARRPAETPAAPANPDRATDDPGVTDAGSPAGAGVTGGDSPSDAGMTDQVSPADVSGAGLTDERLPVDAGGVTGAAPASSTAEPMPEPSNAEDRLSDEDEVEQGEDLAGSEDLTDFEGEIPSRPPLRAPRRAPPVEDRVPDGASDADDDGGAGADDAEPSEVDGDAATGDDAAGEDEPVYEPIRPDDDESVDTGASDEMIPEARPSPGTTTGASTDAPAEGAAGTADGSRPAGGAPDGAPADATARDDGWAVQLAAFRRVDRAVSEMQRLESLGYAPDSVWVTIEHRGRWCRVILGPYARADDAVAVAEEVRNHSEIGSANIVTRGGRGRIWVPPRRPGGGN